MKEGALKFIGIGLVGIGKNYLQMRQTNDDLREIAKLCHIEENLTTYVARHSAATVLKRIGVSTSVIKELLGHETEEITQTYLDSFENTVLDAAYSNFTRLDSFSGCDSLKFSLTIYSQGTGLIHDITNNLFMPSGLILDTSSLRVSYNTTSARTHISGQSVYIPPYVLNQNDSITLSFKAVPNCSYTGPIAPVDTFYGLNFCGGNISTLIVRFDSLRWNRYNQCGPFFTDTIISAHCPGDSSGRIIIWIDSVRGPQSRDSVTISPSLGHITRSASGLSDTITHLPAGMDTISVINLASGCVQVKIVTVGPLPITLSNLSIYNPVCASIHNGSISFTVSGGTSPYTYHWSTGATTGNISGLAAGPAAVTVTDAHGCTLIYRDTLINQYATCCVSPDTPSAALTFGSGSSTSFLAHIASSPLLAGYVSGDTLNSLNKKVYVNGLITLNTDLYLINCPNLLFGVNGGILVDSGHHLYIQGSTLYAVPCGGNMWLGIENTGTGSTVYTSSSRGTAPMIRDARKAIYTHNAASDSILDCKFYNNWDGIYLDGTAGIPLFSISGCTFSTNPAYGALKSDPIDNPSTPHYASSYSDVGVYVRSPAGGPDNATVGSITGKRNYFSRLNCGVYCHQNSLEVVHCTFDSIIISIMDTIHYNPVYAGRAIYVTDTSVGGYALKVGDWNPAGADTIGWCFRGLDEIGNTSATHIIGNRITRAVNAGIYMGPNQTVNILDSIEIAHNTIDAIGTKNIIHTGICMTKCGMMVYIHGNTLRLIDTTYHGATNIDTAAVGISLYNSGMKNTAIIDTNNITHIQQGINVSNWSIVFARENYIGLRPLLWLNTNRYWTGISATQLLNIFASNNLIDGNSDSIPAPTTYTPDSNLRGKLIGIYIQSQRSASMINCNGIQNVHWGIAASGAATGQQVLKSNRFFADTAGVALFANGFIGSQGTATVTNDNEWDTMGTVHYKMGVFSAFGTPNNRFYLRAASLTSYSRYNPNLSEKIVVGNIFPITPVGSPSNSVASCPLPTPTFPHRPFIDVQPYLESIALDTIQFVSDSIDNIKWSHEDLIELIMEDSTILDSSEVIANYYKIVGSASYTKLMQVFYGMQSDTDASNLTHYQSVNASVTPIDVNEQNLQTVNNLYLTYFMSMSDSFYQSGNLMSGTDLSTLHGIASQCYLPGGPAVFLARSMYWTAVRDNGALFWDDCVSPDGGDKKAHANKPNSSVLDSTYRFKVYPNPMDRQNSLNVQCSEEGDISFYNLLGQLTFKAHLAIGINIFNCNQLSCDNNVILYKATMRSGRRETGRIITLK